MICLTEWKGGGGGGGCNFSMSDIAPTFRLVSFYGLEPYPYVAKGSCVSLYDTPSLLNNEYQEKIISVQGRFLRKKIDFLLELRGWLFFHLFGYLTAKGLFIGPNRIKTAEWELAHQKELVFLIPKHLQFFRIG